MFPVVESVNESESVSEPTNVEVAETSTSDGDSSPDVGVSTKRRASKNSKDAYGAEGKTNLLLFNPETLILVTDTKHPLYDKRVNKPIDEAMVKNIMVHGVLEPIIVWKDPETDEVIVADGRQRTKNAIEANKRLVAQGSEPLRIPGVVRRGSAASIAGVMVSANEIRQDDTPMNRAAKASRLLELGKDESEIAVIFGVTEQTVKNMIGLLDASAPVRKAVENEEITVTDAYELARLDPEEQKTKLAAVLAAVGTGPKKKRGRTKAKRAAMGRVTMRTKVEVDKLMKADFESEAVKDIAVALCKWFQGSDRAIKSLLAKG